MLFSYISLTRSDIRLSASYILAIGSDIALRQLYFAIAKLYFGLRQSDILPNGKVVDEGVIYNLNFLAFYYITYFNPLPR